MKPFMDADFLLSNPAGRRLYHEYAEDCPIVDYHNHLPPKDIFERRQYENLAQLWLEADHYKWRAMRMCGVEERLVTGEASDYEKFQAFARIMPQLIGNPVYHWTHLELQRYFGIFAPLNADTAKTIWDETAEKLKGEDFSAVSLLSRMKVEALCTTDDPADSLEWHARIAADAGIPFAVYPAFRPDRFLHIDSPGFLPALSELERRYGKISDWESLKRALLCALDHFQRAGCRVSDHGFLRFRYRRGGDPDAVLKKVRSQEALSESEIAEYQGALLRFLGGEYCRRGIVMQLHLGPIRNNSPKLYRAVGADAGGDSVGLPTDPFQLSAFLGDLEDADALPRTILYGLNPCDNVMLATMAVNFASGGAKVRYGAAWWMQDHLRGITEQLDILMETGQLADTPGMLTDSRSFTSFVRHEYYRRILCDRLGMLVEQGQYPPDIHFLGEMVKNICCLNAKRFFGV